MSNTTSAPANAPTVSDIRSKLSQLKALTNPTAGRWPDDWSKDAAAAAAAHAELHTMIDAWYAKQQAAFAAAAQAAAAQDAT